MINERQARTYCYEDISLIENYDKAIADDTQTWVCHHRVGTIMNCGAEELKAQGCYENRPAHELVFLTPSEHNSLHHAGKKRSVETRAKISAANSGANNAFFGKHHSPETRAKMHATMSSPEVRAKKSAASKGNKAFLGHKHTEATRAKISAAKKSSHWFNNGVESKFCKECPGDGWQRGMLRNKRSQQ